MKRKPRTSDINQPRDFGGYGKLKCNVCGEPYTEHETMELCSVGDLVPSNVIDLDGRRRKVGR